MQGQINASLTSFSRTLDDYSRLAKQEIVEDKKEKAQGRINNFRSELADFREQFDKLKREREEAVSRSHRHPQARADDSPSKPHRLARISSLADRIRLPRPRTHTPTQLIIPKHLHSSQPTKASWARHLLITLENSMPSENNLSCRTPIRNSTTF